MKAYITLKKVIEKIIRNFNFFFGNLYLFSHKISEMGFCHLSAHSTFIYFVKYNRSLHMELPSNESLYSTYKSNRTTYSKYTLTKK